MKSAKRVTGKQGSKYNRIKAKEVGIPNLVPPNRIVSSEASLIHSFI